jgi:Zn-dependent protease with chaperone function
MRLLSALVAALLLPLIALGAASTPFWTALKLRDPIAIVRAGISCLEYAGTDTRVSDVCGALDFYSILGLAAAGIGGLGLALIILVQLAAFISGRSRFLISLAFPVVTFLALICAGVLAVGQAGLAAGSLYAVEQMIGFQTLRLILGLGMAGLVVGLGVLWRALHMFRKADAHVIGMAVDTERAPSLHVLVDKVAGELGAPRPNNIVVGLDPTFFATSAVVHTPFDQKPLRGETLFLSLPLIRMMSQEEVTSVVGHELGHFSGADTVYSKRFAPAYRGLYEAIIGLARQTGGAASLLSIPIQIVVLFVLATFEPAQKRINRSRELRADSLGAKAGSPEGLSSALVKLSVLSATWGEEINGLVPDVRRGRITRNLAADFVERAREKVDHDKAAELVAESLDAEVAHPTDTHPTTRVRIEKLGLDPAKFVEPERFKRSLRPESAVIPPADPVERVEEQLTDLYQKLVVQRFGVEQSGGVKTLPVYSTLLAMLLAKTVTAHGGSEAAVTAAEAAARQVDPDFDAASFREYCARPERIAGVERLVGWGNYVLTKGGASRLKDAFRSISAAGGQSETGVLQVLERDLVGGA